MPVAQTVTGQACKVIAAALALGVAAGSSARADAGGAAAPSIGPLRYDEDYSYLRDPANRSGAWWESLKLVPLDATGDVWLGAGDEVRLRFEQYWNNNFGSGKLPTEGYLRYRELPYVGLNAGPRLRVFTQLQIAYAARSPLTKNAFLDQTAVDLLQGFVDGWLPVGGGRVTLRVGRQVLFYGSGRLVNQGPNIRTSFDGAVGSWERNAWRVDAFWGRPVDPHFHAFDDWPSGARKVWSLYATRRLPRVAPDAGLDAYYFGFVNDGAAFNQGKGIERRHTVGARFFGTRPPWKWDYEANFQVGTFGGSDIRAFSIATDQDFRFTDAPLRPAALLRLAVLSGDGNPHDGVLGTFNPMFAEGGYFGENAVLGPGNLILARPGVLLDVGAGVEVVASGTFYWREALGDGIYDLALNVLRPDSGSRARAVGTQADLAVSWTVDRNLSFAASASILWPGRFVKDTGPALTVYFFGAQTLFHY